LEPVQSSADVRPTSIASAIGFFCDAACARTPDKVAFIDLFGGRERAGDGELKRSGNQYRRAL
jgi:hypothetical protein